MKIINEIDNTMELMEDDMNEKHIEIMTKLYILNVKLEYKKFMKQRNKIIEESDGETDDENEKIEIESDEEIESVELDYYEQEEDEVEKYRIHYFKDEEYYK